MLGWMGDVDPDLFVNRTAQRAVDAWRRISIKPSTITFEKYNGGFTTPQTVRIESDNRGALITGAAGTARLREVVIYGISGHPTLADTDIEKGYIFNIGTDRYTIRDVVIVPGEKQANCELTR